MTLNFIDIASWQDGINLSAIPGLDAFVVKATESTNYVNPICDRYIQSARALNLPIGVYHYAGSSSAKALGDAEAEWRFFRDNCAGYKGEAIPILDYEPFGYSNPSIAWAQAWADACHRDWGVWPVMYVPSYFVNQGGAAWRPIAANCGLWLAQDTGYYQLRMTAFSPPPTPDVADFWTLFGFQYNANGAVGGVSPVDLDVAYVDRAGWQAYATGSTITTTPSEEEDIMSDPQVIELLTQISRQTLGSADALTRGQSGIKWDGDAYRHLAIISDALTSGYPANPDAGIEERPPGAIYTLLTSIESKLDALATDTTEPERAEPETPAEPDASKEAIKVAVTAIRAAADAIEAQL